MSAPTPAEVLDQIAARADAATDGPWFAGSCRHPSDGSEHTVVTAATTGQFADLSESFQPEVDAAFIAHSRHDVPRLVAALRAVLAVLPAPSDENPYSYDPCDDPEVDESNLGDVTFASIGVGVDAGRQYLSNEVRAAIASALGGEA